MGGDEQERGDGNPKPALLDKVNIEDVLLLGEVRGCC